MNWVILDRRVTPETLGLLPGMLSVDDPRPAREQFDDNYRHGGGWRPFPSDKVQLVDDVNLHYRGDPPYEPIAMTKLREETILVYRYGLVAIVQPDRSFEAARMD